MTLSGEKYLTAIVVIIVYIEEVGALIATLCKFAWWNCLVCMVLIKNYTLRRLPLRLSLLITRTTSQEFGTEYSKITII